MSKDLFDNAIERISRPMVDTTIIRCKDCKYWNRRAPRCDRVKGPNGLGAFGFGAYNGCGKGESANEQ